MDEPFAVELYREFLAGLSAATLAAELSIPIDRVEQRLRAAERYLAERSAGESPARVEVPRTGPRACRPTRR